MTGVPEQALAMGFALAGALSYAVASVTQQRTAAAETSGRSLDPALVLRLLRSRTWLLGLVAVIVGYLLQAVALDLGRLLVVEPVFPLGLLLALVLAARADRRSLRLPEWTGATAAVAGLAVFLIAAEPTGGNRTAPATSLGATAVVAVAVAGVCWLASLRAAGPRRALVLSVGGGAGAGVTDALTKTVAALAGPLRFALFGDVRLYLLAACGLVTLTVQQNAYRAAGLAASLPAFVVLEPVVGSLLGLFLYHEGVGDGPLRIAIEAVAVLTALWGIASLARSVSTEHARSAAIAATPAEPAA
ncbi:MAG TPA: DMT family transporter [Streptosporangiaceae bacterium]|nr:DMT family transporter [Streptosporangiaceae bacterium]